MDLVLLMEEIIGSNSGTEIDFIEYFEEIVGINKDEDEFLEILVKRFIK